MMPSSTHASKQAGTTWPASTLTVPDTPSVSFY
jgi:hypothetical protein